MIRNMVTGSIGFIGVGEGGCNVVNKFEKLGYKKVYYINSAMKDLDKIDIDMDAMYHIPNASGCVRNRDTAKAYLKENYDIILDNIQQKLGNLKIIFVVFSMGGGTGSGMSPMLINGLSKRLPATTFNTISIIPDSLSSAKMKYNGVECYNEMKKLKNKVNLGNSYFINNDNACENNKITAKLDVIDNSFVSRLNDLITTSDKGGSVDPAEVLTLLSTPGNTIFGEIIDDKDGKRVVVDISLTPVTQGCEFILYSLADMKQYDKDAVENTYGIPSDDFIAYTDKDDIVTAFGMAFPEDIFNGLKESCNMIMEVREEVKETDLIDISDLDSKFKSKLSPRVKEKAKKNSKDLLAELEDF